MKGKIFQKSEAIKLRKENGMSLRDISKQLSVSKGSVSRWVKDIVLTEEQKENLKNKMEINRNSFTSKYARSHLFGNSYVRDKYLKIRLQYQEEGKFLIKNKGLNFISGCMLYWAEGKKDKNVLEFANTDLNMMKFFLDFLRKNFQISEEKIALYIRSYSKNGISIEDIKNKWLQILNLQESNIRKIYIDQDKRKGSNKNIGKHPYGIGCINLCRTDIVQKIYGAIQEYVGFKDTKWLG
jgi:transcriptional regulator with XRE-family HTH domain